MKTVLASTRHGRKALHRNGHYLPVQPALFTRRRAGDPPHFYRQNLMGSVKEPEFRADGVSVPGRKAQP